MKNINITPKIGARIVVYALLAFWTLTLLQRIKPIVEADLEINLTDMTQVKYLLGLSYSAEEMRCLLHCREELINIRDSFRR
jgi:hypothetical protein